MKYYLVGIKGSALSALAKILIDMGHIVRGCDLDIEVDFFSDLKDVVICDDLNDVCYDSDYLYIIGNAFKESEIVKKIIVDNFLYEYYPQFINNLFENDKVAVTATHGKTTICKLINCLASDKASVLIGDGTGIYNKNSSFFAFEACEYKETFLNYHPNIIVVNNIDYDHPDYYKTKEDYINTFNKFVKQGNLLIYNGDDFNCGKLSIENKISYGFSKNNDYICDYVKTNNGYSISIKYKGKLSTFNLPFYGKHMIYNFLAAFCVLKEYDISDELIKKRILEFKFPKRRNQRIKKDSNIVICDYAHHPTEIKALHDAINVEFYSKKKVIIFQSHTNSRSTTFQEGFKESLKLFDEVYYVDIFSSIRERESKEINEEFLEFLNVDKYDKLIESRLKFSKDKVICFVGAGDIDLLFKVFVNE